MPNINQTVGHNPVNSLGTLYFAQPTKILPLFVGAKNITPLRHCASSYNSYPRYGLSYMVPPCCQVYFLITLILTNTT